MPMKQYGVVEQKLTQLLKSAKLDLKSVIPRVNKIHPEEMDAIFKNSIHLCEDYAGKAIGNNFNNMERELLSCNYTWNLR